MYLTLLKFFGISQPIEVPLDFKLLGIRSTIITTTGRDTRRETRSCDKERYDDKEMYGETNTSEVYDACHLEARSSAFQP